jgi:hypothetical protein
MSWSKPCRILLAVGVSFAIPSRALAQAPNKIPVPVKTVTFTEHIAPILQDKCQMCHRPGMMAPMSLITYEEVRPWVRAIKARVSTREMPPWFVDKTVGIQKFVNDRSLSDDQIDTLVRWVDAGAPLGDPKHMPALRTWSDDSIWRVGEYFGRPPDLVVKSTPYTVTAGSQDSWWKPIVSSGLTEDRWVMAVETKPSLQGRKVVHHVDTALVQLEQKPTPAERAAGLSYSRYMRDHAAAGNRQGADLEQTSSMFSEWAVGKLGEVYAEGTGKLLKAGAKIGFEIHYHPDAETVKEDVVETGFWFYQKGTVPKHRVYYESIGSIRNLDIPPNTVTMHQGYFVIRAPAVLQNFQPHMHLRGKAFLLEAIYPDGRVETINYSPRFSFNWSVNYIYAEDAAPAFPTGTILKVTAWHDNTAANRLNPDPTQWVGGGARSVDEMAHANAEIVYLTEAEYRDLVAKRRKDSRPETIAQQ